MATLHFHDASVIHATVVEDVHSDFRVHDNYTCEGVCKLCVKCMKMPEGVFEIE